MGRSRITGTLTGVDSDSLNNPFPPRRRVVSEPNAALTTESIEDLAATQSLIGVPTRLESTSRRSSAVLRRGSNIFDTSTSEGHRLHSSRFAITPSRFHLLGGRDPFDVFPDPLFPQSRVKQTLFHHCKNTSLSLPELHLTTTSSSAPCSVAKQLRGKSDSNLPEIILASRRVAPPRAVSCDPAGFSGPFSPNAALHRSASSTLVQRPSNSSC